MKAFLITFGIIGLIALFGPAIGGVAWWSFWPWP